MTDFRGMTATPRPLLILHIVAAVGLFGTDLVLVALGVSGVTGADPRTVYPAAYLVEAWLVAPLTVITLATGIVQATRYGWGLARYWWTAIKLATTAAFTVLVVTVIIPRLAATTAAATAGQAFTLAARLPLAIVPAVAIAVIVVNVGLAVYKPAARIRAHPAGRR